MGPRDAQADEPVWIGLGANLGDPVATLRAAWRELATLGTVVRTSSLYRTEPVGGPAGQPPYRNAVVRWRPPPEAATPDRTLAALHEIEARHGRTRRVRNEARTLDLDLLAWGDRVVRDGRATVPHPRAFARAFVLAPWAEIDPDHRDPVTGITVADAWAQLRAAGAENPSPDPDAAWPPSPWVP